MISRQEAGHWIQDPVIILPGPISRNVRDSLNSTKVRARYDGDIEHQGVKRYMGQAHKLGRKLVYR